MTNNTQLELSDESKELKKIFDAIEGITEIGDPPTAVVNNNNHDEEEEDTNIIDEKTELKKHILSTLGDFIGKKLQKGLEKKFGDCGFVITLKPVDNYKYVLENISWNDGPIPHKLFYYIKDKYSYYLASSSNDKFDESMFTRTITDIEKRYTSFFFPLPIKDKKIKSVPIMINRVIENKNTYYSIDVLDEKLSLKDIRGKTLNAALSSLQVRIEGIYYRDDSIVLANDDKKPYDVHKYLIKKYVFEDDKDEDLNTDTKIKK